MGLIRRIFTGVIVLIGLLYGVYFSVRNMEAIAVNLPFFGNYNIPSFVGFIAAFVLGLTVAAVYFSVELLSKSMQLRRLRRDLNGSHHKPHKRVRRFLRENEPETSHPEPSIYSSDSKEF